MRKEFNDTGICVVAMHYMVDTAAKMDQIFQLIEKRKYFTINRPRQFGKTSTQNALKLFFKDNKDYLFIKSSFEIATDKRFESEEEISVLLIKRLKSSLDLLGESELSNLCKDHLETVHDFEALSSFISTLVKASPQKLILSIDEVDSASNNVLFLKFLALLRDKYLLSIAGDDHTFHSVILIGVHDLKRKIRPDEQASINSPWNIAADFTVDMTFNPQEIQSMLTQYHEETGINLDIPTISEKIHYYTSGYPYLVSKMCKVIDEILIKDRDNKDWTMEDVENSFKYLVDGAYTTTLFDDLDKNLTNNEDLYQMIFDIVINGDLKKFVIGNTVVSVAKMYGIIKNVQGNCMIHNRIFEKRIYDRLLADHASRLPTVAWRYFDTEAGGLDLKEALLTFQDFMQEHKSTKDEKFLEKDGRLLFSSFLKPIINGKGSILKEPVIRDERRADLVVTYLSYKYVIELKVWHGERYHKKGLQQLSDYLDAYNLKEGYLLIYDFNKNKEYRREDITFKDKKIFAVWV